MIEVPLTKGNVALIDERDRALVCAYKWRHQKPGYAVRTVRINGVTQLQYMERLIMNAPEDSVVDHRDRNGLNNRRNNLRLCTTSQNMANRGLFKTSTTGYSGVHHYRTKNRYVVKFKKNGEWIYVGCFQFLEDAVAARNKARPAIHGEFGS